MYYFTTETSQGLFTLGDGDATIAVANSNGLSTHCHHLIGPNIYLPAWLVNGKFSADQLTQIMKTHIQTVMGHFKGQCSSWDVVNEALNADGTADTASDNIWHQLPAGVRLRRLPAKRSYKHGDHHPQTVWRSHVTSH
jgi:GH35 family endo-1,4-beta-xylanase